MVDKLLKIEQPYMLPIEPQKENYEVIVKYNVNNEKIYGCPECHFISGTSAPKYPSKRDFFTHRYNCSNKDKYPVEPN